MKCIQYLSIKSVSWTLCLCSALLIQPAAAQQVVLGGQYNVFDDLYIVATVPGNNTANCNNLIATIAAASAPSTVRLPPAIYDCGTNLLDVTSGVTLEGSGQFNTSIVGIHNGTFGVFAVVNTDAEVNNLTMRRTSGTGSEGRVVDLKPGSALKGVKLETTATGVNQVGAILVNTNGIEKIVLHDVTVTVSGDGSFAEGIAIPLGNNLSTPITLDNVNIHATGASTSCGIFLGGSTSTIDIRNSVFHGDTDGISSGTPTLDIAHSQVVNGISTGGTNRCFSVYDANFNALNPDCTTPSPL